MFVMTTNSASSMRLTDAFRPYREQIRFNLGQLDNDEDWAYQLWYVPDSAGWPDAPATRTRTGTAGTSKPAAAPSG